MGIWPQGLTAQGGTSERPLWPGRGFLGAGAEGAMPWRSPQGGEGPGLHCLSLGLANVTCWFARCPSKGRDQRPWGRGWGGWGAPGEEAAGVGRHQRGRPWRGAEGHGGVRRGDSRVSQGLRAKRALPSRLSRWDEADQRVSVAQQRTLAPLHGRPRARHGGGPAPAPRARHLPRGLPPGAEGEPTPT